MGFAVGFTVGTAVGLAVGLAVGFIVGLPVGFMVNWWGSWSGWLWGWQWGSPPGCRGWPWEGRVDAGAGIVVGRWPVAGRTLGKGGAVLLITEGTGAVVVCFCLFLEAAGVAVWKGVEGRGRALMGVDGRRRVWVWVGRCG